jgi:hypothetical protein
MLADAQRTRELDERTKTTLESTTSADSGLRSSNVNAARLREFFLRFQTVLLANPLSFVRIET